MAAETIGGALQFLSTRDKRLHLHRRKAVFRSGVKDELRNTPNNTDSPPAMTINTTATAK
jgi:hypothetical protein